HSAFHLLSGILDMAGPIVDADSVPSVFFFSIIPHPPTYTLFPYTTLFRSFRPTRTIESEMSPLRSMWVATATAKRTTRKTAMRRDRKSTRLNSSHVATSYAVFCLKKKTSKAEPARPYSH